MEQLIEKKMKRKTKARFGAVFCGIFASMSSLSFIIFPRSEFYASYSTTSTRGDYAEDQWAISKSKLNDAWDITTGSNDVMVGVIDSGIDCLHEDLYNNVNSSLSCSLYPANNTGLEDEFWHGTFVSGIIGADGSNSYGISGACWDVDLVSLRIDSYAVGTPAIDAIPLAIDYAAANGIPIINISIGVLDTTATHSIIEDINDAIDDYDGLVVCAAGNGGADSTDPDERFYPAGHIASNILSVGSSDSQDDISSFSNYGRFDVDLFAPGESIWSTKPGDNYDYEGGTSFSAPLVAGVAALLKSANPSLTTAQLKSAIMNGVDQISSMNLKCVSGGRLNAANSLRSVVPEIIPDDSALSATIAADSYRTFRMELSNGRYTVSLSGLGDSRVELYSRYADGSLVSTTFSGHSTHSLQFLCTSPKTVYLKVYNDEASVCSVQLSAQNHIHSYDFAYSPYNATYHRARCECNAYVLEPHLFPSDGLLLGRCAMCNALPPLGLPASPTEGGLDPNAPVIVLTDGDDFSLEEFNSGIYPIRTEDQL